MVQKFFFGLSLLFLWSCRLPDPARLPHFVHFSAVQCTSDSLYLSVKKEIPGPVHFYLFSSLPKVDSFIKGYNPIVLTEAVPEQSLRFKHGMADTIRLLSSIHGNTKYGNPYFKPEGAPLKYAWPFPKGRSYEIMQGYHGSFSHNTEDARYAIDFDLQVGDTVCAAQDGLVVTVLQENTISGADRSYRDYANVITIYHADGLYTQYAHLKAHSAMVKAGDRVKKGQAIALAGMTGFTSAPHLHFNVRKPVIGDALSTSIYFEERPGAELKKGMRVSH